MPTLRNLGSRFGFFDHKLEFADEAEFEKVIHVLERDSSSRFVTCLLLRVDEQLQQGRHLPVRYQAFQELLGNLLRSKSRQADMRLAAFKTLCSIGKPGEVVKALDPLMTEEDMPDVIRSEIAFYLKSQAEKIAKFELPAPMRVPFA